MTPFELVTAIEDADARERRGRRRIILELRAPSVLGQKGKYLGMDPPRPPTEANPFGDPGGPRYGYTRNQCRAMRAAIYEAAQADLQGDPG